MRAVLYFIAPETSGASIKVLEDYQEAKALIENPLSSARSKHIDVYFHFIRDIFSTRKISVEYVIDVRFHIFISDLFSTQKISVECVASAEQHADILT